MNIFDGKLHAAKLDQLILDSTSLYKQKILAIVLVGENASSEKYITIKQSVCEKLGIRCKIYRVDYNHKHGGIELNDLLKSLSTEENVSSIIVQLPLPDSNLYSSLNLLPLEKDIDFLSKARKTHTSGDISAPSNLKSPVVRALEYFIDSNNIHSNTTVKVGIIGQGDLVGRPCFEYLSSKGFSTSVVENYKEGDKLDFDLLVLSTGMPKLIKPQDIKNGCHVVDFGSAVVNGKNVGDLNTDVDMSHLGVVSKSPGGMGPLVVRFLIMNHLRI